MSSDCTSSRSLKRSQKVPGFTLVEILIVIGIIGVLAAILFPVLSAGKEKGKQTACISNLKQIYIALQMYEMDNGVWSQRTDLKQYSTDGISCPDNPRPGVYSYSNWNIWWDNPDPVIRKVLLAKALERGPSYPIVFCMWHYPKWSVVPVLRADGSVDRRDVPPGSTFGITVGDVKTPDL